MIPYPSKVNSLKRLIERGLDVKTVLDVGAHEETLELRLAFPDAKHVLFEPASEFHDKLKQNYAGMDYHLAGVAVSDQDGARGLRKFAIDGGGVSHSSLVSDGDNENTVDVDTVRLDSYVRELKAPGPYLLKVDIDGWEIPALSGATGLFPEVECLIVEATRPSFLERINFLSNAGFELIDIIDQCYYHGVMSQVDLVFISKAFAARDTMNPWETREFSWKQWVPIASFEEYLQTTAPDPAESED